MDELVVIDGNSLVNRAFYALPLLSNTEGEFSNGVYGFINILIKTILERKPKYIAVAFDYGKKTFRNELFSDYKGKRKPTPEELKSQFPILKDLLKCMGIYYIEKQNFEADDLIGSICQRFDNVKKIIITGDRDSLQLISDTTDVWLTKKGITEIKEMNKDTLYDEYKLIPSQIIELKALMGDSSDNILGVSGVGEKTALDLLYKYKDIEGVYNNLSQIKGKLYEKLSLGKESAFLSKKLATIDKFVPIETTLENLEYEFPFNNDVLEFFKRYEFNSLIKKNDLFVENDTKKTSMENLANNIELTSLDEVEKQIKHIKNSKLFCFEINNDVFSFCYDKNCQFYCKIQGSLLDNVLDISEVLNILKPIFEDENIKKYVYDKKLLKHILYNFKIGLKGVSFDCILAYYLLFAGERDANILNINSSFSLDKKFLSLNLITLKEKLELLLDNNNLKNLYHNIEFPLIDVLYDMEMTGFKIDIDMLNELDERYSHEIDDLSKIIKNLAGMDFNINSPKQLGDILFDKLGLVCYNNKKRSTSIEHLEEMFDLHPIVPAIIRYRKIQKIYNGYIEAYKNIVSKDNCVIHTIFNQTLTATGRLSSSEPNLQNIPVRDGESKNLRKIFTTTYEDGALVGADYSQIELRLLAHASQDEKLIYAFNNNIDVHTQTASEVFNVDVGLVTPEMRRNAKAVNFGIIYGISEFGLAQNINSTRKQAKLYIDTYFEKYSKVKNYMVDNVNKARECGFAVSLFNRKRKINDILSSNHIKRQFGERVAMNMPLQGSASDIIKMAMINVYNCLKERNLKSKLILQIHDELIIDCPREEIEIVSNLLKENMENVVKLSIPLTVDVNVGKTLFDC